MELSNGYTLGLIITGRATRPIVLCFLLIVATLANVSAMMINFEAKLNQERERESQEQILILLPYCPVCVTRTVT